MQQIVVTIICLCVGVGVYLVINAIGGFIRVAQGADEDVVDRRLSNPATLRVHGGGAHYDILRESAGAEAWQEYIPFYPRLLRLLQTSGTGLTIQRAVAYMAIVAFATFIPLLLLLPIRFSPLTILVAPIIGVVSVIFYLIKARANRIKKFEEQLPDAIDLIVRSLKIGHPLSGAMSVVARELPPPISIEFGTAFQQVTYGQEIPAAFAAMSERVPLQDLGYLRMAIQIQQESGGNLVESLAKLSGVIRGRFRMFRKVKALTAEGRFSAWFLSLFPVVLIFIIQFIRPDYYTQIMNIPAFPYLVMVTVILLLINVAAMRIITKIKV
jgi:tight adherence protein B